jgi:hypothetical protein
MNKTFDFSKKSYGRSPPETEADRKMIEEFPQEKILHLDPGYAWAAVPSRLGLPDVPLMASR